MSIPDLALGSEWTLLELLCLGLTTHSEQELFEELITSKNLQWGELLEQALRHKILPLLAFHSTSEQFAKRIPYFINNHLQTVLDLNRNKTTILRGEATRIVRSLNEKEVQFVGTKGITLESTLYAGNGSRYFSDIDFMVAPQYRDEVTNTLAQLNYQMGLFDWQTGKVRPHSRERMIGYKLNPDHLPTHVLLTYQPVIRYVEVDVANSLTWTRSDFQVPIEIALSKIVYQSIPDRTDVQMPCFSPKFQFIFTILHLFREAWIEVWLEWGQDVNLSKFADVVRLWNNYQSVINSADFIQTIEEFGIVEPILWVLEHLDRTLHTGIVPALGLEGKVTESWLFSAGSTDGKKRQWHGTMRERLHSKNRRQLFVSEDETQLNK